MILVIINSSSAIVLLFSELKELKINDCTLFNTTSAAVKLVSVLVAYILEPIKYYYWFDGNGMHTSITWVVINYSVNGDYGMHSNSSSQP